ncbi:MAG: hypothetical protein ACK4GL_08030 [Flavobacteriales bacterium]
MANAQDLIIQTLKEKASQKLDLYHLMVKRFDIFKSTAKSVVNKLQERASKNDKRLVIEYQEKSPFVIQLRVASDLIIFEMHTNIFLFDHTHNIWNTSYVQEDNSRAYCGLINVYNFLADSIRFKRVNDVGYLVGRLFMNKDEHFFVEGKRQMGFLYNNFSSDKLTNEKMKDVIESAILYCLNFEMLTPPYDSVSEVNYSQLNEFAQTVNSATGKRLGFRFMHDEDQII